MVQPNIEGSAVVLPLTNAQGGSRLADANGGHFPIPTDVVLKPTYFMEWMITNDQSKMLANGFLNETEKNELAKKLLTIKSFTDSSTYSSRAVKKMPERVGEFEGFTIYKYTEYFYSFEKMTDTGIRFRITFKLGAYSLKPHPFMFVLIPVSHPSVTIRNSEGVVEIGQKVGSKSVMIWNLTKADIETIFMTLAHASPRHRDDLIELLTGSK
ncbi:MAG: hypothetical protein QXL94_06985 [Candidatus Parvarchaeum sp.]